MSKRVTDQDNTPIGGHVSRRSFLKASAGTAALLGAARASFPGGGDRK